MHYVETAFYTQEKVREISGLSTLYKASLRVLIPECHCKMFPAWCILYDSLIATNALNKSVLQWLNCSVGGKFWSHQQPPAFQLHGGTTDLVEATCSPTLHPDWHRASPCILSRAVTLSGMFRFTGDKNSILRKEMPWEQVQPWKSHSCHYWASLFSTPELALRQNEEFSPMPIFIRFAQKCRAVENSTHRAGLPQIRIDVVTWLVMLYRCNCRTVKL